MAFANEGTLTTDKRVVDVNETWETQTEFTAYQSINNIDVSSGVLSLAQTPTQPTVLQPNSGDLVNFTGNTSDTDVIQSNDAIVGDYYLGTVPNKFRGSEVRSTSGLNDYPESGDVFSWYQREPQSNSDNGECITMFGFQSAGSYYGASLDPSGDIGLHKDGLSYEDKQNVTITAGDWYEIEVSWNTNGTITADYYEVDQTDGSRINNIATLSFTDSQYSSGGIGGAKPSNTGGGWHINYYTINGTV